MEFANERVGQGLKLETLPGNRELSRREDNSQPGRVDISLLESINEALTDLLGSKTREAVFDCFERNYTVNRSQIPMRLDDFSRLLTETFGMGGRTIGKVIAKKLYAKLGWEFVEVQCYGLTEYVDAAKIRLKKEVNASRIGQSTF